MKRARLLLALAILAAAAPATAQTPAQDPADRLLREQRSRERQERLEQRTPQIVAPGDDAARATGDVDSIADPEPTFPIERIVVTGNTVLPERVLRELIAGFEGRRLGANRINLLLRRLNQAFIDAGHITTRAYVGDQSLARATLAITVVPGRIERIEYNGADLLPGEWGALGARLAFAAKQGDTLRLTDIEQSVDQLNRLRRNRAEVQILPGQTPGGSVLAIRNRQAGRFYYDVGLDNHGGESTGRNRLRATVESNDLFGLQESLALSFLGSLDSNALLFAGSVPFGYGTFSYTYAYSEFQNLIGDTALLFGTSRSHGLAWNQVIGRSRQGKSAIDLSLSLRESRREINNLELLPQRLSVLRFGYSRLQRLVAAQGHVTVDLGISRGLRALGAQRDPADLPAEAAHAQFTKLDLSLGTGLPLGTDWAYRGALYGQATRRPLFSSEQIFVGGAGTVRGFAESALAGDRGAYTRHELAAVRLPALFGERLRVEPLVFADAAAVELVAERRWRGIAGIGIGARAAIWNAAIDVSLARPLLRPEGLADDGLRLHFTMNISL
jgi:hemolysin activation/secretion protein